jgi:formylglycine-generating enzyme required for sulfatase activity
MEFVQVPAGEFMMGSDSGEDDEKPAHRVRMTRPFYVGRYEVTVGQFRRFAEATGYSTGSEEAGVSTTWRNGGFQTVPGLNWRNLGFPQDERHPVAGLSWSDAEAFCRWVSSLAQGADGRRWAVHLPTETEWEYACRAGTSTKFHTGDSEQDLRRAAWFTTKRDMSMETRPVGQKQPNAWGLFDMHGNVPEWCQDWYGQDYYGQSPNVDPQGPATGAERVVRGGSWRNATNWFRSACRSKGLPQQSYDDRGFRVVCDTSQMGMGGVNVDDTWVRSVQALEPENQAKRVAEKLMELNAGFDGKYRHDVRDGKVVGFHIGSPSITNISPLRALTGLENLTCLGCNVSDLSPLSALGGMKLKSLDCGGTQVRDLTPLKGLPLTSLSCWNTPVSDLSPLAGMQLQKLDCGNTQVVSLAPLEGMPLTSFFCQSTRVRDLSPLKGTRTLALLWCHDSGVGDLSPLDGAPLKFLDCRNTKVTDFVPLKRTPLVELSCNFSAERDAVLLKSLSTLRKINGLQVAEFWKTNPSPVSAKGPEK